MTGEGMEETLVGESPLGESSSEAETGKEEHSTIPVHCKGTRSQY